MSRKSQHQLTVVDLFAGCGGLSLGLEDAGFEALAFAELNKDAAETYLVNRPEFPRNGRFGDVAELLRALPRLKKSWKSKGIERIDLVTGGPPCQGYSGIGHRRSYPVEKLAVPSNHLYKEMIKVIRSLKPRMFLFENVKGIMTGKWTATGSKGEIFAEVLEAFRDIPGYHVEFELVSASWYGVPQKRPRVLIMGFHRDLQFEVKCKNAGLLANGMLPQRTDQYPNLEEVLGDLLESTPGTGARSYPRPPMRGFQEEMRRTDPQGSEPKLTDHEYTKHSEHVIAKFTKMLQKPDGGVPEDYRTRKFAQRVLPARWNGKGPTITATSLPDDFVHYAQPRILTVREWARLQTFPDWYQFEGPRTTGGLRRAGNPLAGIWEREVPKYTQIGNAVPVRLARAIGDHLRGILVKERGPAA